MDFDVIVIGSGFGGAITGCRLAQKNKKVLILERGKEWTKDTYPRNIEDEWIWSNTSPEKYHGWTDLRTFKGMAVITGAGVGGGSLIYANVSAIPPKSVFQAGWPPEITYDEMQPYYTTVGYVLDLQEVPAKQRSPRVQLMQEGAAKLGQANRFRPAPVAVSFDQQLAYDFNDEPDIKKAGPSPTSTAPNRAIAHSWENATSGVGPAQKIRWTRIICFSHRRRAPRSGRSIW